MPRRAVPDEDCEDFVGRGQELQQLLQILGATKGRRLVVLHGPCGMGKSAIGIDLIASALYCGRCGAVPLCHRTRAPLRCRAWEAAIGLCAVSSEGPRDGLPPSEVLAEFSSSIRDGLSSMRPLIHFRSSRSPGVVSASKMAFGE